MTPRQELFDLGGHYELGGFILGQKPVGRLSPGLDIKDFLGRKLDRIASQSQPLERRHVGQTDRQPLNAVLLKGKRLERGKPGNLRGEILELVAGQV